MLIQVLEAFSYSHAIPCSQITMNTLVTSKIFHTPTDLMAYVQTQFPCSPYLYIIVWALNVSEKLRACLQTKYTMLSMNLVNWPGTILQNHSYIKGALSFCYCSHAVASDIIWKKLHTSSWLAWLSKSKSCLFCFTYPNTLPCVIYGIMIRGTSSSKHAPMIDITLGCLNDSMVVTSFTSFSLSHTSDRAKRQE